MWATPPDHPHAAESLWRPDPYLFPRADRRLGVPTKLTDPLGTHAEGRDPSTITNFNGVVGQVDLVFSGTGTDTKTGVKAKYRFHTDTRFIKGEFIGADEQRRSGAFAFI